MDLSPAGILANVLVNVQKEWPDRWLKISAHVCQDRIAQIQVEDIETKELVYYVPLHWHSKRPVPSKGGSDTGQENHDHASPR